MEGNIQADIHARIDYENHVLGSAENCFAGRNITDCIGSP